MAILNISELQKQNGMSFIRKNLQTSLLLTSRLLLSLVLICCFSRDKNSEVIFYAWSLALCLRATKDPEGTICVSFQGKILKNKFIWKLSYD